jgi:AraC-like DNA-binding protein
MPSAPLVVGLVAALVALVVAFVAAAAGRRRRRDVELLMRRLEELEKRLGGGTATEDRPIELSSAAGDDAEGSVYSADALAGWTSHVARVVADAGGVEGLADQAVVRIYQRLEDPVQPSDLAADLGVSLRTLERVLARTLACTPGQLILSVKMREARRMLASGRLRVGQVAHRLAFADASHFSRRYRRFYRCPPSDHVAGSGPGVAVN